VSSSIRGLWKSHLTVHQQPPKRKTGAAASAPKAPPRSKLAKEHNISAQEEGEIKEAFSLFAEPMDGEKNGVIPIDDFKSALM
jgi:hydroxyacylglutathione hydrolase